MKKKNKYSSILFKEITLAILSLVTMVVILISLSTAWFTNVSRTNNITLRIENWGFDDSNLVVSEEPIMVYPGANGVIDLQINNNEIDAYLNIDVNVDKTTLYSEAEDKIFDNANMRKRVYFYIDKSKVYEFDNSKNNEIVDRVYVGNDEFDSYRYVLQSGKTLSMSNDYYSDAPLKWVWVYDLTGYYFEGRIENNEMYVTEYIRPIEYDYEKAVFDNDGNLIEINNKPLREFLIDLSSKDGYYGTFTNEVNTGTEETPVYSKSNDVIVVKGRTYYKVDVEGEKGIFAYLCTKEDIEYANIYDTRITELEEPIILQPKINITISKTPIDYISVSSEQKFIDIFNNEELKEKTIKLTRDITLSKPIAINNESDVSIDLNGLTISYNGDEESYNSFFVEQGSSLNIINGTIVGNNKGSSLVSAAGSSAFRMNGGNLALNNVKINGFDAAVVVDDSDTLKRFEENNENALLKQTNSMCQIINCELTSNHQTIYVMGNGVEDEILTNVEIVDSTINSNEYFGICGSGRLFNQANKTNDCFGTNISIRNSKINGYYAGLYLPQMLSTTNVINSEINGNVGICIKGGTLTVEKSKIVGIGNISPIETARYSGSGFYDTADGIYVDGSFQYPLYVDIIGSENIIESNKACALNVFGYGENNYVNVSVKGGTFRGLSKALSYNNVGGEFKVYSLKIVKGTYKDEGIKLCFNDDEVINE